MNLRIQPGEILALLGPSGCGKTLGVAAASPPAGAAELIVRPEQLLLHEDAGPGRLPVTLGLALPLGGQTIREARLADGTMLRLTEPRRGALAPVLDHVAARPDTWVTGRADIARHWMATHPYPG